MWQAFIFLLTLLVRLLRATCKSRDELVLENLALRQQVTALKLGRHRPKLNDADRAFWIALRKTWANWTSRLVIVKPETVVDWQRLIVLISALLPTNERISQLLQLSQFLIQPRHARVDRPSLP